METFFFHFLYCVSAFFLATLVCRYTILSVKNIELHKESSFLSRAFALTLSISIILAGYTALPWFFYQRSIYSVFIYFLSLMFFLGLSYKRTRQNIS